MRPDNSVADAEAQARTFARLLGSEEGVEDAVGVAYSGSVVDEGDFNAVDGAACADTDFTVVSRFLNRVISVIQDVQEYLLELLGVAHGTFEVLIELLAHFNAMTGKIVAAQFDGLPQDVIQVDGFPLGRPLPCKAEQVLDDFFGALRFMKDDLQVLAGRRWHVRIFEQQVRKTENRGERIIDLMRDAGNQAPDGSHFFRVCEFRLQQHGVRDVGHHDETEGAEEDEARERQRPKLPVAQPEAAVEGARSRLRPILMTSLAMIAGMIPMADKSRIRLQDWALLLQKQ